MVVLFRNLPFLFKDASTYGNWVCFLFFESRVTTYKTELAAKERIPKRLFNCTFVVNGSFTREKQLLAKSTFIIGWLVQKTDPGKLNSK